MNQQTLSEDQKAAARLNSVLQKKRIYDQVQRQNRILELITAKSERKRVLKPKPKRRLKKDAGVVIVSIGGKPVEGVENEFENLD